MFRSTRDKAARHRPLLLRLTAGAAAFCMTGCSIGINVDTMLTPPKLSAQQEQIYQALRDTTGPDIRLKYPKKGTYLSAFIVTDIDGDSTEEAIVFYEKNGIAAADTGLRINILDCIDGEWLSICDRSADGSEIEKVVISKLGTNDRINIIVGYSTSNQSEKYLSVYSYKDDYLEQTLSHSYALFDVADSGSGAEHPDLILLGAATAADDPAYAAVYRLGDDDRYHEYRWSFRDRYTDYTQLIYGKLPDGRVTLYVDAATGTSNLQTEILCLEDGQLNNLLDRCSYKVEDTVRRAGLACMDIDSDGVPEIPVQVSFPGYEDAADSDKIRQTRWKMMQEPRIYTEYYSYYSAGDGYAFLLPEAWRNHVSVMKDVTGSELQFVAYDGAWEDSMPVLLRIYISYEEADTNEHLQSGYCLLHTKGTAAYLAKAESGQDLSLTIGKLLPCFRFMS
ncbi:MAG: hypothetical protein J5851_06575 [Oscillospiraceae bacterium]|nr:hypothetical protein [Oscillospiraceae bacterium]